MKAIMSAAGEGIRCYSFTYLPRLQTKRELKNWEIGKFSWYESPLKDQCNNEEI